jgi:hypothetical protein
MKFSVTSTNELVVLLKAAIDARAIVDKGTFLGSGRFRLAPHLFMVKLEWGEYSQTDPEVIRELEYNLLAEAIDYIQNSFYRTLAPPRVETEISPHATGITVEVTYGEFESRLWGPLGKPGTEQVLEVIAAAERVTPSEQVAVGEGQDKDGRSVLGEARPSTAIVAAFGGGEKWLEIAVGGRALLVGRAPGSDLLLEDPSVSRLHATIALDGGGQLLVADAESAHGSYINGTAISAGEARPVTERDIVRFGQVEVRFRHAS